MARGRKKIQKIRNERTISVGHAQLHFRYHRFDELFVTDHEGKCVLHLEWMHDHEYWIGIYGPKKNVDIRITADTPVRASVSEYPMD
ncbi:MAG: hypothetical protein AABZ06_15090 [Bdellovibrionota bacterium]